MRDAAWQNLKTINIAKIKCRQLNEYTKKLKVKHPYPEFTNWIEPNIIKYQFDVLTHLNFCKKKNYLSFRGRLPLLILLFYVFAYKPISQQKRFFCIKKTSSLVRTGIITCAYFINYYHFNAMYLVMPSPENWACIDWNSTKEKVRFLYFGDSFI